jgi:hypothetical protein
MVAIETALDLSSLRIKVVNGIVRITNEKPLAVESDEALLTVAVLCRLAVDYCSCCVKMGTGVRSQNASVTMGTSFRKRRIPTPLQISDFTAHRLLCYYYVHTEYGIPSISSSNSYR